MKTLALAATALTLWNRGGILRNHNPGGRYGHAHT